MAAGPLAYPPIAARALFHDSRHLIHLILDSRELRPPDTPVAALPATHHAFPLSLMISPPPPPPSRSPNPRAKAGGLCPWLRGSLPNTSDCSPFRLIPIVPPQTTLTSPPHPPGALRPPHAADAPAPRTFAQWPPRPAGLACLIGQHSTPSVLPAGAHVGVRRRPADRGVCTLAVCPPTLGSRPPFTCSTLQPASTMDVIYKCIK